MPVLVRGALVAVCVLLAACDSAAPEAPPVEAPAFVGTWTSQTYGDDVFATLSQTQVVLDPFSPATGGVNVQGAYSATLRYVTSRSVSRDSIETSVFYSLASSPKPEPGTPFVVLNGSLRGGNIGVERGFPVPGEGNRSFFLPFPLETAPIVQRGDTLQIGPNVYTEYPRTGASVTAQGTLILPRRHIGAAVETRIRQSVQFSGSGTVTRTFKADGTFLDQRPNTEPRPGTWSTGPDSTLTLVFEGAYTVANRYRVAGNTLRLTSTESHGCDAACRRDTEDHIDARPGTVQIARSVFFQTFTRGRP